METNENEWDLVIKPRGNLFDLKLGETWKYRDLLFLLVKRDFVSFYKQTILGPVWFFIQPLFTMAMYVFLFGSLAGISTDGLPAPLFYLTGIVVWSYFSECLTKTATVFKDNVNIFGKVYFPRLIMPVSIILSSLIRLGVQLILLAVIMLYYLIKGTPIHFSIYTLLLPVFILLLALLALGMGMIVSALTTKYRDLALLLTFAVQLLMYTTTVVYPLSTLSGKMRMIISANPMTSLIEGLRLGLLGKGTLTVHDFIYSVIFIMATVLFGIIIFNRVEKKFVDTI